MKGNIGIKIAFEGGVAVACRLKLDENPATVRMLLRALPFNSRAELWGDEVYFSVPFRAEPENPKDTVNVGDVAYWPEDPSLCLFFGPTPMSPSADVVKPYSPVNVIGRVMGDLNVLRRLRGGEAVKVEGLTI